MQGDAISRQQGRDAYRAAVSLLTVPETPEHIQYGAIWALIWLLSPITSCPGCTGSDYPNQPKGMVFVGWGRGWERCSRCGGSGEL